MGFLTTLCGGSSKIWAGLNDGSVKEISLINHTHTTSDIASGILPVNRGGTGVNSLSALASALEPYLDTGSSNPPGYDIKGELVLGGTVLFDGIQWIVCHIDQSNNRAYLASKYTRDSTKYAERDDHDATYATSYLAARAKELQDSMSAGANQRMLSTEVNGVTSRVFVASREQLNGGFSYFNSNSRRICYPEGETVYPSDYWTSDSYALYSEAYYVRSDGQIDDDIIYYNKSFRAFCAVTL